MTLKRKRWKTYCCLYAKISLWSQMEPVLSVPKTWKNSTLESVSSRKRMPNFILWSSCLYSPVASMPTTQGPSRGQRPSPIDSSFLDFRTQGAWTPLVSAHPTTTGTLSSITHKLDTACSCYPSPEKKVPWTDCSASLAKLGHSWFSKKILSPKKKR